MFTPKSFFPEYHKSISRLFRLVVFSWRRPASTILPSRMTYGVPSARTPAAGRVVRLVDCGLRHLLQPDGRRKVDFFHMRVRKRKCVPLAAVLDEAAGVLRGTRDGVRSLRRRVFTGTVRQPENRSAEGAARPQP